MSTSRLTRRLGLVVPLLLSVGACADDAAPPIGSAPPAGDVFDTTRHVVIDGIDHDGFETVTVLAHLCAANESGCPDGEEDLVVLASKHLAPGQIYLTAPDVFVEPPEQCRADGMACRMSVVHCEFANEADQRAAGFCLPSKSAVAAWAESRPDDDSSHPCVERRAERSHHIDYGCIVGQSDS